jgi:hypothetical protein
MKNSSITIPDTTADEDDRIFQAVGYKRPLLVSYIAAWWKIQRRTKRDPAFAKLVEAAIGKFVPKKRHRRRRGDTIRQQEKINEADLFEFKRDFGKKCKPMARRSRKRYAQEFGKPIEEFTVADLRHIAKPNRNARNYLGAVWNLLTKPEQYRVENMTEFKLLATGGEVVDWDGYFSERLSKLLKRKIHPPKKTSRR